MRVKLGELGEFKSLGLDHPEVNEGWNTVFIGLGSNLGDRHALIDRALLAIDRHPALEVEGVSLRYETAPLLWPGAPQQPYYINMVARLRSRLGPWALLRVALEIEASLGRVRRGRWEARTIDIDLLWALSPSGAALCSTDPRLLLPHPRLPEREFAWRPLLEVAPELRSTFAQTGISL
ncbi:MAG: 2-amino-4-hydroxy-6-hydroxymethyldihydropteridine diphosphokinase [Sandaracinaceae bacterium]|nr:2-amino-4-hydroxy-6-hydroxymethyldihydropteridine diphosphokinase [Sandaracinaceae bacterium]MDW8246552.1 2-amino-4-hydroxy-6-hydroxymethyldihydropteridine diphosphokinase [Sandaracinaceae bacterium]